MLSKDVKPYILFVDDEEFARKTFSRIVSKEYRVLLAEDVPSAMKILDEHNEEIGVLLSDQRMPGQLGVDLLEYCRNEYPHIVRMLTTAYSELGDAIAAVNRGEITRYIEKPWTNIDGLMVDIRLAMRFFEIQIENANLLREKMSVGQRIARLDKVRALITIASGQTRYRNHLSAVESLLREVAASDFYRDSDFDQGLDMRSDMFGQPLQDTLNATEIAQQLAYPLTSDDLNSWEEFAELLKEQGWSMSGIDINASHHVYPSNMTAIVQSARHFLCAEGHLGEVSFLAESIGLRIRVKLTSGSSSVVKDWLSCQEIKGSNRAISYLLRFFLLAYDIDGTIELDIDDEGNLTMADVLLPTQMSASSMTSAPADWIDDLLLLFS